MSSVSKRVEDALNASVESLTELDGGMIGTVHRVELADGRTVVAKTGDTPLSIESRMLDHLDAHGLSVPDVLSASDELLVIAYVEGESDITPAVERDLADRLASLHDETADGFGFPFDTLTGPVTQPNPWTDDWRAFYAERRVGHVLSRCVEDDTISDSLAARVRDAMDRFDELLTEPQHPGLIHGDVWETNLLTDGERIQAFLDPACYYAHPEVELAYIDWTDTAGDPFFDRYDAIRGIQPGFFDTRRFVYRLYPLLVHLLLFGDPYGDELAETLDRIDC